MITLNGNELNSLIKSHRVDEWKKRIKSYNILTLRDSHWFEDT
jgi:hypothetical protein